MKVSTRFSKKVIFFELFPLLLQDPVMFNKDSTCSSYHIYPNSISLILVFILEAAPAAGSSRFHILDWSTTNFFSCYFAQSHFFINFNLSVESFIKYLKLSGDVPKQNKTFEGAENNCKTQFLHFFCCCIVKCQFYWRTVSS